MAITRENAEFITTAVNAYHRHSVALAKILALCKQASKGDPMAEVYDIVAKTMDSYDVQEALADEVKP